MSVEELYRSLDRRRRPEDIAQLILDTPELKLDEDERAVVELAARGSLKRQVGRFTSMLEDFARPIAPTGSIDKAVELFESVRRGPADPYDPEAVQAFIAKIGQEIAKAFGASDFIKDRLNREQRAAAGLEISRRRYNKLFRLLQRLEAKLEKYRAELRKYRLLRIGRTGLTTLLERSRVVAAPDSAAFLAYYAARCQLRSEFTASGQAKPYDRIAALLFTRCLRKGARVDFFALAHLHPVPEVLERLSEQERGRLLEVWLGTLFDTADMLRQVWERSGIRRETMIVRRGNDSSTWNSLARAWNTARQHWLALLRSFGMESELDGLCPGKVLRLIAADVAAWHRALGHPPSPDLKVWNALPLPWWVLRGESVCTRAMVEKAAKDAGLDPEASGWTAPRARGRPVAFTPTPELVHGVTVARPELARALRRAGWFSGKRARALPEPQLGPKLSEAAAVQRDEHGFVTGVEENR